MSYLIDTHTHIDMPDFEDVNLIIKNAKDAGVEKLIIPAANRDSFERILKISDANENVYCALGIHPTEFETIEDKDFDAIIEMSKNPKVVGIGECGLDYYWEKSPEKIIAQKEVFLRQILIAKQFKKPLIVHDREAHKDSFDLITTHITNGEIPVIMHCFSGSVEFANECLKKGFYIALGGVVTFKNAKKAHEVAKIVPLDRLLVETDAPYLTPEPYRGKRNEPAYVKFAAQRIAELREVSFEVIANATTQNAERVFGI